MMSLAKKCDRCSKCFDPFNMEGRMARFFNPAFQTSNEIRERYRGRLLIEELGVDGIVDLCPECAKAFMTFMNQNPEEKNLDSSDLSNPLDRVVKTMQQCFGVIKSSEPSNG